MLTLMFACALALYLFRFLTAEAEDRSGAHPRNLRRFGEILAALRFSNARENAIVFGTSAIDEKYLILDNMLAVVNFRRHASLSGPDSDLSGDAERRLSEYGGMVERLDQEIARSIPGIRTPDQGGSADREATGRAGARLLRVTHISLMVALGLLAVATAVIG